MILAHLKTVNSREIPFQVEEVLADLYQRLLPENCDDHLDALGSESASLLCKQIVQGMDLGFERLQSEIKGTFALGYITAFVMGVWEATRQKDKRIQILVLQAVIDIVFGAEGKELFAKVVEYLASDQSEFKEGLNIGFQDAREFIEYQNEPAGLRNYLINN